MRRVTTLTMVLLAGATLAVAPGAFAQRDPDTAIKFNLSTPGARSLAMGGAFLALADDVTAAYTNPAGLTNLTVGGSEVAVEWRHLRFSNPFVNRGHVAGVGGGVAFVSGRGVDQLGPGLERADANSEVSGISFLSFAYVLPRGVTLAVYRHELGNFATEFRSAGPFIDGPCDFVAFPPAEFRRTPDNLCIFRGNPRQSKTELDIVNYGLSAAYEIELPTLGGVESTLSFGLGLSYYDFEIFSVDEVFDTSRFVSRQAFTERDLRQPGALYGPPDYSPDNIISDSKDIGRDERYAVNLGLLWKIGREQRWSLAGVYRGGPQFESRRTFRNCALSDGGIDNVCGISQVLQAASFTVPDVLGLGLAFRTEGGRTKVALDLNRVRYSQRLPDYTQGLLAFDPGNQDVVEFAADFLIEDADQIHLGVERIVLVVESLFVGTARFGAWREPFHDILYTGDIEAVAVYLRRPADAEVHLSFGFGLAIKEDFQLDFAADLSDPTTSFSVSIVKFL